MECLDKYLEAISHVNNTNMFSLELTDNIELQGKSSAGSLSRVPEVFMLQTIFLSSLASHSLPWPSFLLVMNVEALLR